MTPDFRTLLPLHVQALTIPAFGRRWRLAVVFGPLWWQDGRLAALELLSRFTDIAGGRNMSPDIFFTRAPREAQRKVLLWQLALLTRLAPWCTARQVPVSLNITRSLAQMVLTEQDIAQFLRSLFPGLRLEISEHFLEPAKPPAHDALLQGLRLLAPLWLDDFGAGTAGLHGLLGGGFEAIKVDRYLFRNLVAQSGGVAFLQSLTELSSGLGTRVIAEGVESFPLAQAARDAGVSASQGWLWPEVTLAGLTDLPDSLPGENL